MTTLHGLRERPTAAQPGAPGTTGSVRASALVGGRASAATDGRGPLGVVLARPLPVVSAMAMSSISEETLARGYGGPLARVERCACGGAISVMFSEDPRAVAYAVLVHNLSTTHEQWAIEAEWR